VASGQWWGWSGVVGGSGAVGWSGRGRVGSFHVKTTVRKKSDFINKNEKLFMASINNSN
jgi:hypothetical protein